jgi:hypothetical protein
MARVAQVTSLVSAVRRSHRSYRRNAYRRKTGIIGTAVLQVKAVSTGEGLEFAVADDAALLYRSLRSERPSKADFRAASSAVGRSRRNTPLGNRVRRLSYPTTNAYSLSEAELAAVVGTAVERFRDVVERSRGLKPKSVKDRVRDAAWLELETVLVAVETMVLCVTKSGAIADDFSVVATTAINAVRD